VHFRKKRIIEETHKRLTIAVSAAHDRLATSDVPVRRSSEARGTRLVDLSHTIEHGTIMRCSSDRLRHDHHACTGCMAWKNHDAAAFVKELYADDTVATS
jgi:hypothetical protein